MYSRILLSLVLTVSVLVSCTPASVDVTYPPDPDPITSPVARHQYQVAMLISMYDWDQALFERIYYGLFDNGAEITVLSTTKGFMDITDRLGKEISVNYIEDDVDISKFEALIVLGGENEYTSESGLAQFLHTFDSLDRIIGALSGGIGVLARAGMLDGVSVAAEDSRRGLLSDSGAELVLDRVFIDGRFVTASVRSERMFSEKLIQAIRSQSQK